MVGTFRGTFKEFDARVSDASGSPEISGRAKVQSVQVSEENLYGHLLSPEFFDAEQHPRSSSSRRGSPARAISWSSTAS
jgi:polyisoprenoid-binding protein YceI